MLNLATTMNKTIDEILAPKPEAHPRICAYSIDDKAHAGLFKLHADIDEIKEHDDA